MSTSERTVYDFDPHSAEYADESGRIEHEMRTARPVVWSPNYEGFWAVTGHRALGDGLRDRDNCSSEKSYDQDGNPIGGLSIPPRAGYRMVPDEVDPPEWDGYRKLLARAFAPSAIDALRPDIQRFTDEVIDHSIENGEVDFVMGVASPVTALITLDIMGLPLEDWRFYAEPIHELFSLSHFTDVRGGVGRVYDRLRELVDERRESPVGSGLVEHLINSEIDGEPITEENLTNMFFNLLVGGFDTTAGLMSGALKYLDTHRDIHQRLIDDPAFMRTATEEFVRWISPVAGLARTAARDFDIEGQQVQEGDRIWFMFRAANYDPEEFDSPDEIDLERSPNRHFAFGSGIHRCLGSSLARAVFQIVTRSVLIRMPDFKVDHEAATRYVRRAVNNGWATMPITFTPGPKVHEDRILEVL